MIDIAGVTAQVIAFQSDKLGFVSLVGFMIVFYAFLADIFIFAETLTALQTAGALLILCVTVIVSIFKIREEIEQEKALAEEITEDKLMCQ